MLDEPDEDDLFMKLREFLEIVESGFEETGMESDPRECRVWDLKMAKESDRKDHGCRTTAKIVENLYSRE